MGKLTSKKTLLDTIGLSEGASFECDRNAILEEYNVEKDNKSSLAIKALSILGGFLATLTFLGFLLIAGFYKSELALCILGGVFIVSAILLNKIYAKLIIDTFSISLYVVGFVLFSFGLSEMRVDENIIAILVSLLAVISLIITQNYILSFISVLIINSSFVFLIIDNDFYDLLHVYISFTVLVFVYLFLNEAKIISFSKKISKLYNPVRAGVTISLLFGLASVCKKHFVPISQNYLWISSIVIILAILYLVSILIKINEIDTVKNKAISYLLSLLILVPTIFSPAISGAMLIILLSFLVHYKTGFAIGVISLIYFISQYYYDLSFTLLTKSILLFTSGVVFLLFYVFINKYLSTNEKI